MPQIPEIVAPNLAPPPEMDPRIAGKPGQVMANVADQFAQVSDFGLAVAEKIKRAQDAVAVQNAGNSIEADIQKAEVALQSWSDYTNADALKQSTAEALHAKYAEKYGNRPDLWQHIQLYLGQELNQYNHSVDVKAAKLTAEDGQAGLSVFLNKQAGLAAIEPTMEGKSHWWDVADAQVDIMQGHGIINPLQAEQMKQLVRAETIETEVATAANPLNSPEVMQHEMDMLKQYEGKNLIPPEDLAKMQAHLGEALKVAQQKSEEKQLWTDVDKVVSAKEKDATMIDPKTGMKDYPKMIEAVDADESIPLKTRRAVRDELESRETNQTRAVNDRDQQLKDDLFSRIGNKEAKGGVLTPTEVKLRNQLPHNDPKYIPDRLVNPTLKAIEQNDRQARAQTLEEMRLVREERDAKSLDIAAQILEKGTPFYMRSDLLPWELKGLTPKDANAVWETLNLNKDEGFRASQYLFDHSPLAKWNQATKEGQDQLVKDKLDFARIVQSKKLTGAQIVQEWESQYQSQIKADKEQKSKDLLNSIMQIDPDATLKTMGDKDAQEFGGSQNALKTKSGRQAYFDELKQANPTYTDKQINDYLDKKGVK